MNEGVVIVIMCLVVVAAIVALCEPGDAGKFQHVMFAMSPGPFGVSGVLTVADAKTSGNGMASITDFIHWPDAAMEAIKQIDPHCVRRDSRKLLLGQRRTTEQ